MMKNKYLISLFIALIIPFNIAVASPSISEVDYFASIRAGEANVRSGPGTNYPIKFVFKLQGMPIHVISEYDNWNEIKDFEGQTGWISKSLLTKKRTLMVRTTRSFVNMHQKNSEKSRVIFRLENNVIGDYLKCLKEWCAIKVKNKKGWVRKGDLFGG